MPFLLFGIFLVTRIWLLVSCPEEFIISDEGSVGLLYAWLRGVRLVSLSDLYSPFMGGNLLFQVLSLPFFLLLGDRILAVKLLAMVVASLGFWLIFRLSLLAAGRRAALFACLAYSLAPLGPAGGSMVGTGDHFLSGLLVVLLAWMLVGALRSTVAGTLRPFAVGLLTGFSTWLNYAFLLTLPGVGAVFLARRGQIPTRARLAWLAGFTTGLVPLVAGLVLRGSSATLTLYSRSPLEQVTLDPAEIIERVALLARAGLLGGAWFAPGPLGVALSVLWILTLCVGLLALIRHEVRSCREGTFFGSSASITALFMGVVLTAFTAALVFTRFEVDANRIWGLRYLLFAFPAICVLWGVGMSIFPIPQGRGAGAVLALLGLVSLTWPASLRAPLRILDYPGTCWNLVLQKAIAERGAIGIAHALLRMDALVEPQRSSLLWEYGAQIQSIPGMPQTERFVARELGLRGALHASRGALQARSGLPPHKEEHKMWPMLGTRLLYADDGPRIAAAFRHLSPGWRVPESILLDRLERRPARPWELGLLAACLGARIHERAGWAGLDGAEVEPSLEESLWFGAAQWATRSGETPPEQIVQAALNPPAGAHPRGYPAGLASSFALRGEVARDPGAWLVLVRSQLGGETLRQFSAAIGTASTRLLWRSTHGLAVVLRESTDTEQRAVVCEAMGQGVAERAKTLTDTLRWGIDWERFAGTGCGPAFKRGMVEVFAREYAHDPEYQDMLEEVLRLPDLAR